MRRIWFVLALVLCAVRLRSGRKRQRRQSAPVHRRTHVVAQAPRRSGHHARRQARRGAADHATTSPRTRASRTCGWCRWPAAPPRQLTSDKASDTQPTVSPDGNWVAFVSKRGDDTESQIYVIAIDGGEARRVTNLPTGASVPKWFPDSKRIAFVSNVWPDLVRWEDQAARKKRTRVAQDDRARVDPRAHFLLRSLPRRSTAAPVFDLHRRRRAITAITRMSGYWLSKTETRRVLVRHLARRARSGLQRQRRPQRHRPQLDVILLPTCGCKPRTQHHRRQQGRTTSSPRYSPDGRRLAFAQQRIAGFYADRARLMIYDRNAAAPPRPHGELGSQRSTAWSGSATRAACSASIDDAGTRRVYRFRLDGAAPVRADPGVFLRRAGAVGQRQGAGGDPPEFHRAAHAGRARRRAAARPPSSATSTMPRWPPSISRATKASPTRAPRYADIQMWVFYPPGFDATQEIPGADAAARRPAQCHHRCRAVALECAGVRQLGLRRHLAQLPWLERLRQRLRGLDQPGPHHAALRGHDPRRGLAHGEAVRRP